MKMPGYEDVKKVVDGLVEIIKHLVAVLREFVDGFKKDFTYGPKA